MISLLSWCRSEERLPRSVLLHLQGIAEQARPPHEIEGFLKEYFRSELEHRNHVRGIWPKVVVAPFPSVDAEDLRSERGVAQCSPGGSKMPGGQVMPCVFGMFAVGRR